jgi:hypothetical protein
VRANPPPRRSTLSPTFSTPSLSPSLAPTTPPGLCPTPPLTGPDVLAVQFADQPNTPSVCGPWSFGWTLMNEVSPDAFKPMAWLLVEPTSEDPTCLARHFGMYEPWGEEAYVWKAFEDQCSWLPARAVASSTLNPLAKVMLHTGRLVLPRIRWTAPSDGFYVVLIQYFPADATAKGGEIWLEG